MKEQMPRFIADPVTSNKNLTLSGQEAHHCLVVLRMRPGEQFIAIDGKGSEFLCSLESVVEGKAFASIIHKTRLTTEPVVNITLAIGISRPAKMDLIIQKTTELGVRRVVPIISAGSYAQAETHELKGRADRWNRIAIGATKQSLRSYIPRIANPIKFRNIASVVSQVDASILFIPNISPEPIGEVLKKGKMPPREVLIIVGSEGGFEKEEIEQLLALGVSPCSLGKRRLRTETAAIVAVSLVLYEMGELS